MVGDSGLEDLLQRVIARVEAGAAGDGAAVTEPAALAEVEQLLDGIDRPGGLDMRVQYAAGMLHWNRWVALGEAGRSSAQTAELLLTPLHFVHRSWLPAQLAELLDARVSPPHAPAERAYELALALATLAEALDRSVFLDGAAKALDLAASMGPPEGELRWSALSLLGQVLLRRHEAWGDPADLDRAVDVLRQAVRLTDQRGPELVPLLLTLGRALVPAVGRAEDPEPIGELVDIALPALRDAAPPDRDAAISLAVHVVMVAAGRPAADAATARAIVPEVVEGARRALLASNPDDPDHLLRMVNLGTALCQVGDAAATTEAVGMLCAAITGLAPDSGQIRRNALGALRDLLLLDTVSPLDDASFRLATSTIQQVCAGSRPGDPDHAVCLMVGGAAFNAAWARGDKDARPMAIQAMREYVAALPEARRDGTTATMALSVVEREAPSEGDQALLDDAIALHRRLVTEEPVNRVLLPRWLAELATMLFDRCAGQPELALLDEAIAVHRRLLALNGTSVDVVRSLELATLLRQRSVTSGDRTLATEAVELLESGLAADGLDPTVRAKAAYMLSVTLADLAWATGDLAVAQQAEAALWAVIDSDELPDAMPSTWHNLAQVWHARHDRTGIGMAQAIEAARRAVALGESTADGQSQRLAYLAQLLAMVDRFDEAVPLAQRAVASLTSDDPGAPRVLSALAVVQGMYHRRFGDAAALDLSVAGSRAVLGADDGATGRVTRLMNLASILRVRHTRSGDLETLEEAVAVGREAVRVAPAGHPSERVAQANLVVQLTQLYRHGRDGVVLAEAIDLSNAVVAATGPDDARLADRLGNRALAHSLEFGRTAERGALEQAVDDARRAVELTPAGHPNRGAWLSNLAGMLSDLAELTGDRDTARAAVQAARDAVASTPDDHPSRGSRLYLLAVALCEPALTTNVSIIREAEAIDVNAADARLGRIVRLAGSSLATVAIGWPARRRLLREAGQVAQAAGRHPSAPPLARLLAWVTSGGIAAGQRRWDGAAEAMAEAVRLLPRIAARNLKRADAEHRLTDLGAIPAKAAACAVNAGDVAGALTVLEQGRGVLLSHALDTRTELTDLHTAAPELARAGDRLVHELDEVDEPVTADEDRPAVVDRRHALASEWDALMGRVRELPGFDRFMEPPTVDELLPAAEQGAVITVNVSELRCDALVATGDGVRVVPLRELHATDVEAKGRAFLDALALVAGGDLAERMDGQAAVRETLRWLWDVLAEPVLTALGHTTSPPPGAWPRVWWSPTGLLNFLPLHAAGYHDEDGRAVLDRVVSSYTPTLRALRHARGRPAVPDPVLLAVAMSETPDQPPLPATVAEADALVRAAPDGLQLMDGDARHDSVVAGMARYGIVHLACHAVSDPASPSESRLLLHDRPLAVREVSRLRLQHAELAYLSACSTAQGSTRLADEAIHIASAFQLAGFRHVVGTLWPVVDTTSAQAADGFHARYRRGMPAAEALHEVTRQLRSAQPGLPSVWAAYVHAGP